MKYQYTVFYQRDDMLVAKTVVLARGYKEAMDIVKGIFKNYNILHARRTDSLTGGKYNDITSKEEDKNGH